MSNRQILFLQACQLLHFLCCIRFNYRFSPSFALSLCLHRYTLYAQYSPCEFGILLLNISYFWVWVHSEDFRRVRWREAVDVVLDVGVFAVWNRDFVQVWAEESEVERNVGFAKKLFVVGAKRDFFAFGSKLLYLMLNNQFFMQIRIKNLGSITILQQWHEQHSIIIICHPSSIVDVSRHKQYRVPWNLLRLKYKILEHLYTGI